MYPPIAEEEVKLQPAGRQGNGSSSTDLQRNLGDDDGNLTEDGSRTLRTFSRQGTALLRRNTSASDTPLFLQAAASPMQSEENEKEYIRDDRELNFAKLLLREKTRNSKSFVPYMLDPRKKNAPPYENVDYCVRKLINEGISAEKYHYGARGG